MALSHLVRALVFEENDKQQRDIEQMKNGGQDKGQFKFAGKIVDLAYKAHSKSLTDVGNKTRDRDHALKMLRSKKSAR